MGKVIGINGRPVTGLSNRDDFVIANCQECGWPHFRWAISEGDTLVHQLECNACAATYTFKLQALQGDDEQVQ